MGPLPHGAEKMMENTQKKFPATKNDGARGK